MSSRLYNKDAGKPGSKGKPGEESRTGTKRQIAGSSAVSSKVPRKSTVSSKETRNNEKSAAGDSESESGSSSDSDSEPRMTLSERFAKLTQMSTDKREFAKPVLAMNEIDTKLKVVKDLRNADVKIYVDGLQQKNENSSKFENTKMRPKSPDYSHADGEKRYSSDDRRRHFERMARDEPRERPADWSDSRVRYEYYR
ncbi:unnamed protein product [Allacma fusca]|uniref:Uncharacterized protein n=1 Tax=Allacma fusca TaxID=39272 RepID=A0A8J2PDF8_9HEXA|nr:unnamed protein product [Allacma fusca]